MMPQPLAEYRCSFCGKEQSRVHRLIAGPGRVYICDECIDLCAEIIAESGDAMPEPKAPRCSFCDQELEGCMTPSYPGTHGAVICRGCVEGLHHSGGGNAGKLTDTETAEEGDVFWEYLRLHADPIDTRSDMAYVRAIDPRPLGFDAIVPGMPLDEAMAELNQVGWECYRWEAHGPFLGGPLTGPPEEQGETTYVFRRRKLIE